MRGRGAVELGDLMMIDEDTVRFRHDLVRVPRPMRACRCGGGRRCTDAPAT